MNSLDYISSIPELLEYDDLEFYKTNSWTLTDLGSAAFQTHAFENPYTINDNEVTPSSNIY
jgi:hypothetical protein